MSTIGAAASLSKVANSQSIMASGRPIAVVPFGEAQVAPTRICPGWTSPMVKTDLRVLELRGVIGESAGVKPFSSVG